MLDRIIISQLNNKHAQILWVIISEGSFGIRNYLEEVEGRGGTVFICRISEKVKRQENGIQRRQRQT